MTKRISKYVVYIEEETLDTTAVDAFYAIPGYVEHEWLDWSDS